jgi:uncharacterized NAD-dependent epimerase/dehydratase family protein
MGRPGARLHPEFVATLIVESAYFGDEPTLKKYDVSSKSLARFRKKLLNGTDEKLSQAVSKLQLQYENRWAERINKAIEHGVDTIEIIYNTITGNEEARKLAARNPQMLEALTSSVKMLASVKLADKVISAKIAAIQAPQDFGDDFGEPDAPRVIEPRQIQAGAIDVEAKSV